MMMMTMMMMCTKPVVGFSCLRTTSQQPLWRRSNRLCAQSHNFGESSRWKLPNDFSLFLNQCTIQSMIFLVNSLRDRHTALWLEDFTSPIIHKHTQDKKNQKEQVLSNMRQAQIDAYAGRHMMEDDEIKLLTYHGLAAINTTLFPTWDSYFEQLLQEPTVTYQVESNRPHVPKYEMEINPASLCTRLISVREQIAREFVKELDVLADVTAEMLQRFENPEQPFELQKPDLYFLEFGVDGDYKMNEDYKPSPLRKGNFDLLVILATQESIHRLLNNGMDDGGEESMQIFLRNFYTQRIGTHFTGSNWYGRADDFLEELLTTSGHVQLQDEQSGLVDPFHILKLILQEREKVASEWLDIALDAPLAHTEIKRWQLNRLMGIDTSVENSFE